MIVLVTGTLVPGENVFALQLVDRDKRIGEYAESLKKLMVAKSVDKVVFCENSGDEQAVEKLREQLYDCLLYTSGKDGKNGKLEYSGRNFGFWKNP